MPGLGNSKLATGLNSEKRMHQVIIHIPSAKKSKLRSILNRKTAHPDYDQDGVIAILTANFPSGHQVDIKVCNGDGPYIDAVLFAPSGNQIGEGLVPESITGEFIFQAGDERFQVTVI